MNVNAQYELYMIKAELQSIINELYSIEYGVRNEFHGIGNEKCSNAIRKDIQAYESAKRRLENMDLSAVTEEFLQRQVSG